MLGDLFLNVWFVVVEPSVIPTELFITTEIDSSTTTHSQ